MYAYELVNLFNLINYSIGYSGFKFKSVYLIFFQFEIENIV